MNSSSKENGQVDWHQGLKSSRSYILILLFRLFRSRRIASAVSKIFPLKSRVEDRGYWTQFSSSRPSTLSNSAILLVTKVMPRDLATRAMSRS